MNRRNFIKVASVSVVSCNILPVIDEPLTVESLKQIASEMLPPANYYSFWDSNNHYLSLLKLLNKNGVKTNNQVREMVTKNLPEILIRNEALSQNIGFLSEDRSGKGVFFSHTGLLLTCVDKPITV